MLAYLVAFALACSVGFAVTRRAAPARPTLDAKPAPPSPSAAAKRSAQVAEPERAVAKRVVGAAAPKATATMAARRPALPGAVESRDRGDTSLDLSDFIPADARPTAAQVIDELHARGIYEGLGAFPPPGTNPPMTGLAVPDDFVLPDGYVRHYQTTDDGQDIEPILMFSPDYDFVDENGNPLPIPGNRVVPPDMAPPGLPIREIDIPPDLEPGRLVH